MNKNIVTLAIGLLMTGVGLFAADSSVGTWKWNAAKSKTNSTNPVKSRTDVFEATADGGIKVTRTEQRADGTSYNGSYTFKYDGKEYPVKGLQYDTVSAKRVDANTITTVVKKTGGKLSQTTKTVFASDGKSKTATTTGTDTEGKSVTATMVYDKQ